MRHRVTDELQLRLPAVDVAARTSNASRVHRSRVQYPVTRLRTLALIGCASPLIVASIPIQEKS